MYHRYQIPSNSVATVATYAMSLVLTCVFNHGADPSEGPPITASRTWVEHVCLQHSPVQTQCFNMQSNQHQFYSRGRSKFSHLSLW